MLIVIKNRLSPKVTFINNRLSPKVTLIHVIARSEMNKEDKKKGEKGTYKKGDTQKRGHTKKGTHKKGDRPLFCPLFYLSLFFTVRFQELFSRRIIFIRDKDSYLTQAV